MQHLKLSGSTSPKRCILSFEEIEEAADDLLESKQDMDDMAYDSDEVERAKEGIKDGDEANLQSALITAERMGGKYKVPVANEDGTIIDLNDSGLKKEDVAYALESISGEIKRVFTTLGNKMSRAAMSMGDSASPGQGMVAAELVTGVEERFNKIGDNVTAKAMIGKPLSAFILNGQFDLTNAKKDIALVGKINNDVIGHIAPLIGKLAALHNKYFTRAGGKFTADKITPYTSDLNLLVPKNYAKGVTLCRGDQLTIENRKFGWASSGGIAYPLMKFGKERVGDMSVDVDKSSLKLVMDTLDELLEFISRNFIAYKFGGLSKWLSKVSVNPDLVSSGLGETEKSTLSSMALIAWTSSVELSHDLLTHCIRQIKDLSRTADKMLNALEREQERNS